jgi:hypothetical protein
MTDTDQDPDPAHVPADLLAAGMDHVRASPRDAGTVALLVTRPGVDERVVHERAELDTRLGLAGDTWVERGSRRMPDGSANPEAQVTVMNSRVALLVAGTKDRVPLAGDQIYVDLDLSVDNLPTGTVLDFGDAALEVTAEPHTGCAKFSARFGVDALRLTATPEGRQLRLRGINARVLRAGSVGVGDVATVVRPQAQ